MAGSNNFATDSTVDLIQTDSTVDLIQTVSLVATIIDLFFTCFPSVLLIVIF